MVLNISPLLKSFSPAPDIPPTLVLPVEEKRMQQVMHVCVCVCLSQIHRHTWFCTFFLTFLCLFCSVPIEFLSAQLTVVLNIVCIYFRRFFFFLVFFTFLSESWGGLYRFFVMQMSTLCRLTLLCLHESCFKCFLFLFCFLCYGLNHIRDAFVLVLWRDDSQTLRPFVISL